MKMLQGTLTIRTKVKENFEPTSRKKNNFLQDIGEKKVQAFNKVKKYKLTGGI